MNLNTNARFAMNPEVNIKRSTIDMSFKHLTTANAGKLYPAFCKEVLPGDTWSVDTSILARMQTLLQPIMDDLYLDFYFFFCPTRLLWKHWQQFCGESDTPWYDDTVYTIPQIDVNVGDRSDTMCVKLGSLADHLGMPLAPTTPGQTTVNPVVKSFNHLPFRGYVRIWNEWFRDQNLQDLAPFNDEDATVTMNNEGSAFYGGDLLPVNKYRDYFTSCLPEPQKGPAVTIGVGSTAPVFSGATHDPSGTGLVFRTADGGTLPAGRYPLQVRTDSESASGQLFNAASVSGSGGHAFEITNLWSDISAVSGISINELRVAFATQQFYEKMALGGSRYIEILANMFGVQSPDGRLQRSEFLGGNRIAIQINQVTQNSETNVTPLGSLGAYSLTTDSQYSFDKSFTEHGYLYGLYCIRYKHSYQNGYERMWNRRDRDDFYWPVYANIGNQPVLNKEIYCDGSAYDEEVFGYQEAWADYRFSNNYVTGEMRSAHRNTLDSWHLADDYSSKVYLSADWQKENTDVVNRVLAVSDSVADQFLCDFYFSVSATRPMPIYSIPGLDIL